MKERRFLPVCLFAFFVFAMSIFAFVACEMFADEEEPESEWYVSLPASDGAASSSDWTQADVKKYTVTLSQNGKTVLTQDGEPGERITLNRLSPGNYDIVVEGFNADGEVIADGGGTVYLETGKTANITIQLTMRSNKHDYTLSYSANSSDASISGEIPKSAAYNYHDEVAIQFPNLTRTGYDFDGWNTASDGSGTAYRAGGTNSLTIGTSDITLYAQWIPYSYTVAFDGGASAAQGSMTAMTLVYDTARSLSKCNYTRAGYVFVGWSRDSTVHENETTAAPPIEFEDEAEVKNLTAEKGGSVMLYAKWFAEIPVNYRVEHHQQNLDDDGYTLFEEETAQGFAMKRTEAKAKDYEGFSALDFEQTYIVPTYDDGEVAVVKIYYDRKLYRVTYSASESGVANLPAEQSYRYGKTVKVESEIPGRTGYLFSGWSKDTDSATLYAHGDTILHDEITDFIKSDITMHAQWTAITYTIHYSAGSTDRISGTMEDSTATYDTGVSLRTVGFSRDGYIFAGWAASEGGAKVFSDGASVMNLSQTQGEVVTLYALWSEGNSAYTVEHYLQNTAGSTILSDYELADTDTLGGTTGEETAAQAKTTYTGFTAQSFSQATITNDGETTIKIYYNRNPYTLTFDGNGDTGGTTAAQTFYYGVAGSLRSNGFSKTGYSFAGWATGATSEKSYDDGGAYTIGAGDAMLYATWTANQYAITLSANDATTAGTILVTATYDAEMPAIAALPQRTGYAFAGFFTQANGGGTQYYSASGESLQPWDNAGDTTLYAHWVVAGTQYTVEHYLQNTDLTTYTLSDTETLTGTTGDSTAAQAKTTYGGFVTPTVTQKTIEPSGTVVEIKYDRSQYTLTFDGNGNTGGATTAQTFYYGVAGSLTANGFTRTGYAFSGWATSATSAKQYDDTGNYTIGAANATLYATWSPLTYTVTLNANGGTGGTESVTATYEKPLPAVTAPSRTGYVFSGYYDNASATGGTQYYNANGVSTTTYATAGAITLYARWTEATNTTYTVRHYQQNITGDTLSDYTLFETESLTGKTGDATAATAKSYTGFNAPTVTQSAINADGSTVVNIYYERKTFTVTYTAGDGITSGVSGMPTSPQTYRYGASITVANEEPTRSGYAFNGWMLGSDTTTRWKKGQTVSAAITENLTLTAAWSNATITIKVSNERGSIEATKTETDSTVTIVLQTAGAYIWKIDDNSTLPSWATLSTDRMTLTIDKTAILSNSNFASGTTKNYQISAVDMTNILNNIVYDYKCTVSITKP